MSRSSRSGPKTPGLGRLAAALALVLALVVGALALRGRAASTVAAPSTVPASTPPRLVDAVPADTTLFVEVELAALRGSRLGAALFDTERSVEGVGSLRAVCGFDPLERVRSLAVVVPPTEGADFAVIATGDVDVEPMVACATRLIEARGGKPLRSTVGSFASVRDAASTGGAGELAVRAGLLVLGGGAQLRNVVDTVEGRLASLGSDPTHGRLRAALPPGLSLRASLVLTPSQRAVVRQELEAADASAPRSLARLHGGALGVALDGERLRASLLLASEDEASARELSGLLSSVRDEAASAPTSRLLGTAELLRRARFETRGADVWLEVDTTTQELERAGARAAELRSLAELGLGGGSLGLVDRPRGSARGHETPPAASGSASVAGAAPGAVPDASSSASRPAPVRR